MLVHLKKGSEGEEDVADREEIIIGGIIEGRVLLKQSIRFGV